MIFAPGELPEWSNGADSKSVDPHSRVRGFESLTLRSSQNPCLAAGVCVFRSIQSLLGEENAGF